MLAALALGCGGGEEATATAARPSPSPLARLERSVYANSLHALLGDAAWAVVEPLVWLVPDDARKNQFDTATLDVTAQHVVGWTRIAEEAAKRLARNPQLRAGLTGCAEDGDVACLRDWVRRFGRSAWRRPLDDAEVDEIMDLLADAARDGSAEPGEGVELALLAFLLSPHFLYREELRGPEVAPGVYQLTAYEQVTRLAMALWGRGPDASLLDLAATHDRLDAASLHQLAQAMVSAPAARDRIRAFYDQWLQLRTMQAVRVGAPFIPFPDQAGLQADMTQELHELLLSLSLDHDGTYAELMTTPQTAIHSQNLAKIYGLAAAPADGQARVVGLRDGLLTRPGMLVATAELTSPVRRGVFVLRRLLCEDLQSPDPSLFDTPVGLPPVPDGVRGGRERWTQATGAEACATCHSRINALGFALEKFDSAGRYRETEYTQIAFTGGAATVPIDDKVTLALDPDAPLEIAGAAALGQALAQSQAGPACMARQWFRYAAGRRETDADLASIEAMGFDASTPLRELFAALAATDELQVRSVAP